jgi:S-adenosylmethionine synthetase
MMIFLEGLSHLNFRDIKVHYNTLDKEGRGLVGTPIGYPQMANAQVLLERNKKIKDIKEIVQEIFKRELKNINRFCLELAEGRYPVC